MARSAGRSRVSRWAPGILGVIAPLALLEGLSRSGVLLPEFPPVSVVAHALAAQLVHGSFWLNVGYTLEGWAAGLAIAAVLAFPAGILIGSKGLAYRLLRVPIEFLRPIPSVALIPLAVLVFGTDLSNKVFLVAFGCFWPLLLQAVHGMQDVDPLVQDTVRSFGITGLTRFFHVTLPSISPYLATGIRLASSVALVLAVTCELIVGVPGVGEAVLVAQSSGDYPLMYALIAATGVVGVALDKLIRSVERRAIRWQVALRGEAAA